MGENDNNNSIVDLITVNHPLFVELQGFLKLSQKKNL
jgi:hypothetical protein